MSVGDILDRDEDRPAYVQFERRAVTDGEATLRAGHHVSKDEDYALITPPYSKDMVEKKVSIWFSQVDRNVKGGRIPARHFDLWKESYKRWLEGQEPPVDGTSVKDWSSISPAQCQNLINAGCRTIEDLAQINDEGIRRLGMGGHELKNKAKAWLQAAKDHGPLTMEVSKLRNENEQLKGSIGSLQEQIKLMSIRLDAQSDEKTNHSQESGFSNDFSNTEYIAKNLIKPEGTPAEQYEEKFGKKPHHRMKEETILEKLQE